ncbi:hypothetical protein QQ045_033667 [Rhodiola kirilowii]
MVAMHVEINKTFTITVKASETIENIKALIKQREVVVPTTFQELVISGIQLKDGNKLSDYITVGNSVKAGYTVRVMLLETVQIFVQIRNGEHITVSIKLSDSVLSLKKQIFDKAGYPVENQSLIFLGRVLEDGKQIVTYGIQKDSTVHLRLKFTAAAEDSDDTWVINATADRRVQPTESGPRRTTRARTCPNKFRDFVL